MISLEGNIVTDDGVLEGGTIRIEDGRIIEVLAEPDGRTDRSLTETDGQAVLSHAENNGNADFSLADGWIVPGFIDVHVHGGYGSDFMEATPEAFDTITRFHGQHGTTSMLATTMTAPKSDIDAVLQTTADYMASAPAAGARLLGVHLEGPFISPHWPGAQNPNHIVPPNLSWVREWTETYTNLIRQLTLAPEIEGADELIAYLHRLGVNVAAGHTDACFDQIITAVEHGLSQAVHTFNAMTGLHHREPGVAGATLTDPRIVAEVIADGVHVHPAVVKLLTMTKTDGNLVLITDAMAAAGLGDGQYSLGGLQVTVQNQVARLSDSGALAGSTLTMIDAFRFMVQQVGLSVPQASRLASANAARQLGIDGSYGTIRPGASADLVLLDRALNIVAVYRDGQRIAT